jgi:hypothetical protein
MGTLVVCYYQHAATICILGRNVRNSGKLARRSENVSTALNHS